MGAKCPRDGYYYIYEDALDDAEQDSWIGTLAADKYVILALISEGGMGAVYRAMQLPVQREVAFKVLRAELEDSDQGRDRFVREARAVSRLTHPNIITMHDFGFDSNGHPYMVMEYAPGKSLAGWMRQPGLNLQRITHVFRQILSSLSEAHEQGIVHRDLKPENLIVTRTGKDEDYIKLLDFGIARMVHDGATRGLTKEGEVFGTPHYMAPEQAQGKKNIGPPADVYALGIMFYELLTGDAPFDAATPLSILYMHINDDLPPLEPRTGIQVPDSLRQIIDQATAKKPEDRFQTASEMLATLDQAMGNTSGLFPAPGASGEFARVTESPEGSAQQDQATAETLMFAPGTTPPADASSNQVAVDDPQSGNTTGPMTAELAAVHESNPKKIAAIAAILALLLGGGVALLMTGGETDDPVPADDAPKAAAISAADEPTAPAPDPDEPGEPGETEPTGSAEPAPAEAQVAAREAENAEQAEVADETAELEAAEQPEPAANDSRAESDERTGDDSAEPASTTAQKSPTSNDSPADTQSASSEPAPTPARDPKPSSTPEPKSAEESDSTEPKKFQPKKFEPKSDDSEPKKFEPRKWR